VCRGLLLDRCSLGAIIELSCESRSKSRLFFVLRPDLNLWKSEFDHKSVLATDKMSGGAIPVQLMGITSCFDIKTGICSLDLSSKKGVREVKNSVV